MRILYLTLFLLANTALGSIQFGGVSAIWNETNTANTTTITFTNAIPAGSIAIHPFGWEYQVTNYATSMVDLRGNTWNKKATNITNTVHQDGVWVSYITTAIQAGDTATVNWLGVSAVAMPRAGQIFYFTGVNSNAPEVLVTNISFGSNITVNITTLTANATLVALAQIDQVASVVSNLRGLTLIGTNWFGNNPIAQTDGLASTIVYTNAGPVGTYTISMLQTSNSVLINQTYMLTVLALQPGNLSGINLTGGASLTGNVSIP